MTDSIAGQVCMDGTATLAHQQTMKQFAWRPSVEEIVQKVVRHFFNVSSSEFYAVRRHGNVARIEAIYLVRRLIDQSVSAIAEHFAGVSPMPSTLGKSAVERWLAIASSLGERQLRIYLSRTR